ncbi:MAG: GIY-YIG nuclease family protein [Lachnospiraceae bacterium]|nr:GIY-YIG nuclease family protein [Lachnospiraceae bacterium]
MKAYTYILGCADGSLYTGWTTDPERRLKEHNGELPSRGAKCTRVRRPCRMLFCECFEEEDAKEAKRMAMRREYAIKQLSRKEKLALIENAAEGKQSGK